MALTLSLVHPQLPRIAFGNAVGVMVNVTFDSSYDTGGESLTASDLGLSEIFGVFSIATPLTATETVVPVWDSANSTLQLAWTGGAISSELDEITAATDVSALTLTLLVIGV